MMVVKNDKKTVTSSETSDHVTAEFIGLWESYYDKMQYDIIQFQIFHQSVIQKTTINNYKNVICHISRGALLG